MFLLISHFCTAPTLCGSLSASRSGAARQRAEFQLEFRKKGPIFSLSPSPQRQQKKMRGGGEIVEVQGGHIVRSACRKDRHSKVCTAKGTRDRRVRLSARTAIQFYDVQDRLGYDRPSKAVDWLIKNAKAAIDELAELPAAQEKHSNKPVQAADGTISPPSNFAVAGGDGVGGENSSFLPPSLASDAISDTINSFFPVTAGASYSSNRYQDLRLSLQSVQNPILYHNSAVFSSHGHFSFNAAAPCDTAGCGDGGGYDYSVLLGPAVTPQPLAFGRSQFFAEGGTLQSSNSPSAPTRTDLIEHNLHPTASSSGGDCLPEFHFRAWTQGEDEHNGITDKPSSVSCGPHH